MIWLLTVLSVIALGVFLSLVQVPTGTSAVVERLGKYHTNLNPGYHFIYPIVDELKKVHWTRVQENRIGNKSTCSVKQFDLTYIPTIEQFHDLPSYTIVTSDRIQVSINAFVFYKIMDVPKALYSIDNLYEALESLIEANIRSVVASIDFETIFLSKNTVIESIHVLLRDIAKDWGIQITKFEIQDVNCSNDILTATERSSIEKRQHLANIAAIESKQQALIMEQTCDREISLNKIKNDTAIKLASLESQKDQFKIEHDFNQLKQESMISLRSKANEQEANEIARLLESGATTSYLNNKILVDGWSTLASGQNSKIFVPAGMFEGLNYRD